MTRIVSNALNAVVCGDRMRLNSRKRGAEAWAKLRKEYPKRSYSVRSVQRIYSADDE